MLLEEDKQYIEKMSSTKLDEGIINKIEKHMNRYKVDGICAYYFDWEDFCSDWCEDIGYTRTQARKKLHGGEGEFQIIDGFGIIRYTT